MTKGIIAAIVFLIVCAVAFFGTSMLVRSVRASVAQHKGDAFVQKLYAEYAIVGKSCQGEDTDADAYVSCDFRLKGPEGNERIVHLQCPTIWKSLIGNVCKEARLVIPQ